MFDGHGNMTPGDVAKLMADEINIAEYKPSAVELRRCLVDPPRIRTYLNGCDGNSPITLWLVLEEDPVAHSAYEVVYDEEAGQFGLAAPADGSHIYIGLYGTFLETLEAM